MIKEYKFTFKPIGANEEIIKIDDFYSNRIWAIDFEWLSSLKKIKSLGMVGLTNRIERELVKVVRDKMEGKETPNKKMYSFKNLGVDFSEYKEFSKDNIIFCDGYRKSSDSERSITHLKLTTGKVSRYLCFNYAAALYFDDNTKIFLGDNSVHPIVLKKDNKVVFVVSGLNPRNIEGKE